jgi:hypothetical protein
MRDRPSRKRGALADDDDRGRGFGERSRRATGAGRADTLFSDDALSLIHQDSRGPPRAANNLGVQTLVAAFTDNKAMVDVSPTRAAVTEVTAE